MLSCDGHFWWRGRLICTGQKFYTVLRFLLPDSTNEVEQDTRVSEYLLRGPPAQPHLFQPVQDEAHTVQG